MKPLTIFYRLSILIVVLGLSQVASAQHVPDIFAGQRPDETRSLTEAEHEHHDELVRRAFEDGVLPVIVEFRTRLAPEAALPDEAAVQVQRTRLAAAQERVLQRLEMTLALQALFDVKRFNLFPGVSMHAEPETLADLLDDPSVLRVIEDKILQPLLSESIPLVGGDASGTFAGRTGFGQVIAVLDTGVDKYHPFLQDKVVSEACYSSNVPEWGVTSLCPDGVTSSTAADSGLNCSPGITGCGHGTHVAGIAGGSNASFSGVAQDSNLIAIQVFSEIPSQYCGEGAVDPCVGAYTSDILEGLERVYALRSTLDIASANLSLGGGAYDATCDDDPLKPVIDNLRLVGIATIAASGNDGFTQHLSSPACISSAVSVGSTTKQDAVSSFSNSADMLDLLAPGQSIRSSVPGDTYAYLSGTSMAAPHVAGAWAVLKEARPDATVEEILDSLIATGQMVTDPRTGANSRVRPRIAVADALAALEHDGDPTLTVTRDGNGTVTSSPAGINCGSICSASFSAGSEVALTATSASGWVFAGWSGNCSGSSGCSVSMTQSRSVGATFVQSELLSNASPLTSLSGSADSETRYHIDVPADSTDLVVTISGGTGDADLYVRHGALPTLSVYACRPWLNGNEETCTFASPAAGRHHIMLHGFESYSGVTLSASYDAPVACPHQDDLTVGGTISTEESYSACRTISTASSGFTITATGDVQFNAGERITLRPGFRIQSGGRFSARIQ
ncbi:MAG: S8 family serine peptidase [Azoarcus sp.]|nr:S8 family serine peptidase [Azoarcus sp.]